MLLAVLISCLLISTERKFKKNREMIGYKDTSKVKLYPGRDYIHIYERRRYRFMLLELSPCVLAKVLILIQ